MRHLLLCMLAWLLGNSWCLAQTDTSSAYTLQQCIALALDNNLQVRQAGWQAETGRVNRAAAVGNMLPFLSGSVNHGINEGRSIDPFSNNYIDQQISFGNYALNGNITLWNGLSLQNTLKQAHLNYQASQMDMQQMRENVTLNIILAYLMVLSSDEQTRQADAQTNTTARQVDRLRKLDSLGAIPPSQLYDLQGQLATDRLTAITARSNAQNARLALAQLMNVPFSPHMQVAMLTNDASFEPAALQTELGSQTSFANLPLIRAADLRVRSAQKGLMAARGLWSPSLFAYGNLGTTYSSAASRSTLVNTTTSPTGTYVIVGTEQIPVYSPVSTYRTSTIPYREQWSNNLFSSIGLGLQLPILNGNQTRTRMGLARIARSQASFVAQTTRVQVQQAAEQALLAQQNAVERYRQLKQQVHDFQLSFQAAEARLEAGVGTSIDYLVVKNNADRARSSLIAARYEVILRGKVVEYYAGTSLTP